MNICANGKDEKRISYVDRINTNKKCVWNKKTSGIHLNKFRETVSKKYKMKLVNYWDLYRWSVEHCELFWEEIWKYFNVISSTLYNKVMVRRSESILDVEWFSGALLNYAENMLRFRDERTALICVDEDGEEEFITHAEMYEEVKVYATSLRKHGLRKGDTVACYMANRKEAVFAMLATSSIGARWGGPVPLYGTKAALDIITQLAPKFLFTCDKFKRDGTEYNLLQQLPLITEKCNCIQKTIVVVVKCDISKPDISNIKNSCYLEDFLIVDKDGEIPEIIFEQLPLIHPLFVNFTSGTTGVPKGFVHSAAILLSLARDFGLHYDVAPGNVVYSSYPVGFTLWNIHISSLFLGATVLLFNGNPCLLSKSSFCNLLSKYKVNFVSLVTSMVDAMKRYGCNQGKDCNLENLKLFGVSGSPVKLQHFDYIAQLTKNNGCITALYGATESLGRYGGFDLNEPVYSGEIQLPSLGLSIACFNDKGEPVIGERGEVVITKPFMGFPLYILGDDNNRKLRSLYFSKYAGVWCQNDIAWIDPETKGFVVLGRSDDVLNPLGVRFNSSEIYDAIHAMKELSDYICVPQNNNEGDERAILFVKMAKGAEFNETLVQNIKTHVATQLSVFHVPAIILKVEEIPYNLNSKRMENIVKKIIQTNQVPEVLNIKNPDCLIEYRNHPELQNY